MPPWSGRVVRTAPPASALHVQERLGQGRAPRHPGVAAGVLAVLVGQSRCRPAGPPCGDSGPVSHSSTPVSRLVFRCVGGCYAQFARSSHSPAPVVSITPAASRAPGLAIKAPLWLTTRLNRSGWTAAQIQARSARQGWRPTGHAAPAVTSSPSTRGNTSRVQKIQVAVIQVVLLAAVTWFHEHQGRARRQARLQRPVHHVAQLAGAVKGHAVLHVIDRKGGAHCRYPCGV